MIQTIQDMSHPLSIKKLILIAKIFFMCNSLSLLPFLTEPGKLDNWIQFIVSILEHQVEPNDPLIQPTDDMNVIEQLDQSDYWQLKATCCRISVKLYQK